MNGILNNTIFGSRFYGDRYWNPQSFNDLNFWLKEDTRSDLTLPNSLGGEEATILLPYVCEAGGKLSVDDAGALDIRTNDFTLLAHIKNNGATKTAITTLLGKHSTSSFIGRYGFYTLATSGNIKCIAQTSTAVYAIDTGIDITTIDEVFLRMQVDQTAKTLTMFYNEIQVGEPVTFEGTFSQASGKKFTMFANVDGVSNSHIGLSDVHVFQRKLTTEEALIIMNRGYVAGAAAYYPLSGNLTYLRDVSGNGMHLTFYDCSISYGSFGSRYCLDHGYSKYENANNSILNIPYLETSLPDTTFTTPGTYSKLADIEADLLNHNLAFSYINIPYDKWDRSDETIWSDKARVLIAEGGRYDATNPNRWHASELNRIILKDYANTDYKGLVFSINNSINLTELISYENNKTGSDLLRILNYCGKSFYNESLGFTELYSNDHLEYKYSNRSWFYQRDNIVFTMNDKGFIFYSEDGGETFPYVYEFDDAENIQMCHIFANGIIHFATRTRYYYSSDKLKTLNEYIVEDSDGTDYIPHTPVNPVYPGSYFAIAQVIQSHIINGKEVLVFGNYSNSIFNSGASPTNVYRVIDGGRPKIIYKFGQNGTYKDDGTENGGAVGNSLGDATNPLYCRHVYTVTWNVDLGVFVLSTGVNAFENHWIELTPDWITDIWTVNILVESASSDTRWKSGAIVYYDGYYYFTSGSTLADYDYGLFKVTHANIGDSLNTELVLALTGTGSSFSIENGTLIGRSAIEGDFIFYSPDLVNYYMFTPTYPDIYRDTIVGCMNNSNDDGYFKFNINYDGSLNYSVDKTMLIKFK
jgi:hypothetical protein